jgi:hypothetical protein
MISGADVVWGIHFCKQYLKWLLSCWIWKEIILKLFHFSINRGKPPAFTLVSCSAYSTLKMEVICSCEISVGFQRTTRRYIAEYCHVSRFPWLIMTGFGLHDWIYWHCYYNQLQSLITAHNQWLSKTRSIPYWTTSVFSSTTTAFYFVLRVLPTCSLEWILSSVLTYPPSITSREPHRTHRLQGFHYCCSYMHCAGCACNTVVTVL